MMMMMMMCEGVQGGGGGVEVVSYKRKRESLSPLPPDGILDSSF
jgi:hypothetical protein